MSILRHILYFSIVLAAFFSTENAHAQVVCPPGAETKLAGVCVASNTGLSETGLSQILTTFVSWLAFTFGSIAIIILIVCGFQYLFAGGDDSQAENAKSCMKWAVVGIIVVGLSWTVVRTLAWLMFGLPPLW